MAGTSSKARKTSAKRKTTSDKKVESRKKSVSKSPATSANADVTVDRRAAGSRRSGEDRRKKSQPVAVERRQIERRAKVNRRRQIDPTTCERDYSVDEIEFMSALDDYKRASGRMFPTCSEVLEVIRKLGYEKRRAGDAVMVAADLQASQDEA